MTKTFLVDATTRGVGGSPRIPVTSVGEENLLDDEADAEVRLDTEWRAAHDEVRAMRAAAADARRQRGEALLYRCGGMHRRA